MNGPANLLRNSSRNSNHWVLVRTVGNRSNRDGIGARIEVRTGSLRQIDEVRSGGSYLSQSDLRLHFGLGQFAEADEVTVWWPSGAVDRVHNAPVDCVLTIEEGKGLTRTWSPSHRHNRL